MSKNQIIEAIEKEQIKTDVVDYRTGDTVAVSLEITEGNRTRIQIFEGVLIKSRNRGIASSLTIRKISNGVGVERTFPIHSPKVKKIDIKRRGKVRKAKLFYLRELSGKAARIKEKL